MIDTCWLLLAALPLLAIERVSYAVIWRWPEHFRMLCQRLGRPDPVPVVRGLFLAFKVLQFTIFGLWITAHGGVGRPALVPVLAGSVALAAGQWLNLAVFARLGTVGVFYGTRFGHAVQWCTGFPFSLLSHPQYVGTVLSIWGLFLLTRYPASDWSLLPMVETVLYMLGARAERLPHDAAAEAVPSAPTGPAQSPRPAPLPGMR